jgi:hypothetical protein
VTSRSIGCRASIFDVVISRFGTMFFADPVAAFRNIARAARPQAPLVMLVWSTPAPQRVVDRAPDGTWHG